MGFGPGERLQSCLEPSGKFVVSQLATGDGRHDVRDNQILHGQPVSASDRQQFHEVESRALVPVHKAVIGDDAVDEGGRLLVNTRVVAMIGPGDGGRASRGF